MKEDGCGALEITANSTLSDNITCDVVNISSDIVVFINTTLVSNDTVFIETDNFTLGSGSHLNASGAGYVGRAGEQGLGPGGGTAASNTAGGAGHGGHPQPRPCLVPGGRRHR